MPLFPESVPDPFNVSSATTREYYRIEPAWRLEPQSSQIVARSTQQFSSLLKSYAARRATECPTCTQTHLDEYECRIILHDEINFAKAATVIPLEQNEIIALKKRFRIALRLAPIQFKGSISVAASFPDTDKHYILQYLPSQQSAGHH
jgi:hypothetical protein